MQAHSIIGPVPNVTTIEKDLYLDSVVWMIALGKDSDADLIDLYIERALIALARPLLPEHDDYTWFRH